VKNHDFTPKILFFPILGGAPPPPLDPPLDSGIADMDWNLRVVSVLLGDQKCLSSSVRRLKYILSHLVMHENFSIVLIVNIGNDKIAKKLDITVFEISQMLTLMQRSSKHLVMTDILIL
jgi:hypothetical protein